MARSPRSEQFNHSEVSVFHCMNRCVRRCFLCGLDPDTGANYEHRKDWIEARLEFLAAHYGIDLVGFSVLSNHFHAILRNRPDVVAVWSDQDVAYHWLMLCPIRKQADGSPETPAEAEINALVSDRWETRRATSADDLGNVGQTRQRVRPSQNAIHKAITLILHAPISPPPSCHWGARLTHGVAIDPCPVDYSEK